ncbi:hypothetical protein TNCV_3610731 [Trichonephila clavipes]|nr:hypothetical protein TNCV_3610731 [Trichonephila clavipes]
MFNGNDGTFLLNPAPAHKAKMTRWWLRMRMCRISQSTRIGLPADHDYIYVITSGNDVRLRFPFSESRDPTGVIWIWNDYKP